jgi:hypothetical protein
MEIAIRQKRADNLSASLANWGQVAPPKTSFEKIARRLSLAFTDRPTLDD